LPNQECVVVRNTQLATLKKQTINGTCDLEEKSKQSGNIERRVYGLNAPAIITSLPSGTGKLASRLTSLSIFGTAIPERP